MSTPEGRIKDKFKRALAANLTRPSWKFMPVQTGFGSVAHDFIICYDGLFFTVEAKKDHLAKMTGLQYSTKDAIESAGGIFLLVYDDASITAAVNRMNWESEHNGRHRRENRLALHAQDQRAGEQHLREQQQGETYDPTACGDHGALRTPPAR